MPYSQVTIIGAPLDLGQGRRGVDMGPSAMRVANLNARVASLGYEVEDLGNVPVEQAEAAPSGHPRAKYLPQIAATCQRLAAQVEQALARGSVPLVLGGDHSVAIGTVSGAAHYFRERGERLGLIWLDAHADMNTPDSSPSGNVHGMPLACIVGHGPEELTGMFGFQPKIAPRNAIIVGLRDVDQTEKPHVRGFGVHAFTMREIDERGMRSVMEEAMRLASEGTAGFHLSLDMDFVDPKDAPGVGARRRHLPRSAFGNGNDLRFASNGLDGSGGSQPGDRRGQSHRRPGGGASDVRTGKAHLMSLRVAVIYGGRSGEHEVSVRSARAIMDAMDPAKYERIEYFIDKQGKWTPRPILPEPGAQPDIDVVFPVLHGTFGEDGTVQGLLELADLPYVGAGVLGSAVSMDKEMMKRVCAERMLPVVDYVTALRGCANLAEIMARLPFPMFVKPANLGSSVGISKARNADELAAAIALAGQYDRKIIVERAIVGRELECSVLGNEAPMASLPCEILPSREFYDYDDKYLLDRAATKVPADLPQEKTDELRRLAVECYRAVECEGMGRVDFLLEAATDKLYINEINTIPGFTSISMYPKMWEQSGIGFAALIDQLIELALDRHKGKKATRFTR